MPVVSPAHADTGLPPDPATLRALADRALYEPLRSRLEYLAASGEASPGALNALAVGAPMPPAADSGRPIRFVAAAAVRAAAYESSVHERGEVGTRPGNWHDLFNALVWMVFPRTKAALNALHVSALVSRPTAAARGLPRDAATQFDESGVAVLSAQPGLVELMRAHRWVDLFWTRRTEVRRSMRFLVFGHGLYDALRRPFPGLCGRAAFIDTTQDVLDGPLCAQLALADGMLAARFAAGDQYPAPRALSPLPVLGIPGVTPRSQARAYYEDVRQFRPAPAR